LVICPLGPDLQNVFFSHWPLYKIALGTFLEPNLTDANRIVIILLHILDTEEANKDNCTEKSWQCHLWRQKAEVSSMLGITKSKNFLRILKHYFWNVRIFYIYMSSTINMKNPDASLATVIVTIFHCSLDIIAQVQITLPLETPLKASCRESGCCYLRKK
jgi:hypothetical protein